MSRNRNNYNRRRNYGRDVSRAMSSGISGTWQGFIKSLDLSDNIMIARDALDKVDTGAPAMVTMILSFIIMIGFGAFAFQFDVRPTYFWVFDFVDGIKETLPVVDPNILKAFIILITLTPSAVEMFAPRYGIGGIKMFSMTMVVFLIFDAITDTPNVSVIMRNADLSNWGQLEWFAELVIPLVMLFFFSYMAEVITLVSAYIFVRSFGIVLSRKGRSYSAKNVPRRNNNQNRNQNNGQNNNNQNRNQRRQKPARVPRGESFHGPHKEPSFEEFLAYEQQRLSGE